MVLPKAVIFDFNGVIVNDFPIQKEAWTQMSQELRGTPVTDEEMIKQIRGVPTKETIRRMGGGKLNDERIIELAKRKDTIVQSLITESPLFRLNNGLEPFLNSLQKFSIPRTIATSSSKDMFNFLANRLRLDRWFDYQIIVFNDGSHKGKPAPDPYILAAKALGLEANECVVFEDAKSGIQSAHDAGSENIYAVGTDERLAVLTTMPGVLKGIHDFTEVTVEHIFHTQ